MSTAGCPLCDETVKRGQSLARPTGDVTVYDLCTGCETDECRTRAKQHGIQRVPAVVRDGKPAGCCKSSSVTAEALPIAGRSAA